MTPNFSNLKMIVLGDLMLDQYLIGPVERISPEAPVPVVHLSSQNATPGGAANVAMNLAGLNAQVILYGKVGLDLEANNLRALCVKQGVQCEFIESNQPTITKTRVMGNHQQMLRIDREEKSPWQPKQISKLLTSLKENFFNADGIILSDYGKGFFEVEICQQIIALAQSLNKPIFVDPKGKDWQKYRGATCITPNFKEYCEHLDISGENSDQFIEQTYSQITSIGLSEMLLITRSEKGMTLCSNQERLTSPAMAREVFDVSGAGDTVIATFASAYSAGFAKAQCLELANKAAGIVVGMLGTTPISLKQLVESSNELDPISITDLKSAMQARKGKSIFTNGCFDLLHRGHLEYLRKARELGDYLIVGLNSDESVRRLKGESRPLNTALDRAAMLQALSFVDYVIIFEEDTPAELLNEIKPHTLVKGGDYTLDQVIGRELVNEVVLIDFVKGYSSTRLIQKIMETP